MGGYEMILFIDDEKWAMSGILDKFLNFEQKDSRYHTRHFKDADGVLSFIQNSAETIHLIILDLMLPYRAKSKTEIFSNNYGGVRFLEDLRKFDQYDQIPILIYTAIDENVISEYKTLKNIHYISRNTSDEKFYLTVKNILNQKV